MATRTFEQRQLFIDGKWVDAEGGQRFTVENPATTELLGDVASASIEDVDRAAQAAHRAFTRGPWATSTAPERARVLYRLAQLLRAHQEELARLESLQAGKTIRDARDDVGTAAGCFEYYAGAATKLCGETIPVDGPGLDFTLREPVGVAALIVPWNFPLAIAAWKVAPALAAGCTVVLKPASATPLTALALAELAEKAELPAGVLNILTGSGALIGRGLVEHPHVRKVAFTGETTTGQEILRAASHGIKRVSLELGGKSPLVVFDDVDVAAVAKVTPWSVFGNAGQDCCARSRGFVHERIYDEFVEAFAKATGSIVLGPPLEDTSEMGPLISKAHRERVESFVRLGSEEGATRMCGGERPGPMKGALAKGYFLQPAVFRDVRNDMQLAQQEIFGPVACFIPFREEDELVSLVNDTPFGLSGSIWTRDISRALRVARQIKSGVLGINSNRSVFLEAPFGGFKMSGLGRDLGMEALRSYTEVKNIYVSL